MKSLRLILTNPRYLAPAWVFASLNIWFGTWAIYIPTVQSRLGIDKADLGLAIFFLSLGVFTVFPVAARIINRLGVGRATWIGVLGSSFFAFFPLIAPNYYALVASLFFFGLSNGFTDIAMNTLVTEIEKEDRQNFMSAAHGFFSLGGVLAGLGSFLIPRIDSPALHMGGVILLVLLANAGLRRQYLKITAAPVEKEGFSLKLFRPLLLLGIISFVVMGGEGAVVDWSGLYLKEVVGSPEYLWGGGFLAFSVTMTLGRFLGDGISARIGSVRIVAAGSAIAVLGYLSVLWAHPFAALAGFALVGLGFSVIIPELFRIGGNVRGVDSSQGVAFIAGTGYSGFLAAPPVLGYLAEAFGLRTSFWVLLGCATLVLLATGILKNGGKGPRGTGA
ncbi:MFS transporter [Robiginitalea biformata]|uniref:Major facilitator superfamily MFS_1 n=1 Tax=Robiginitalea biformata (strain ATCC BAA-864 / DSM 15991 / KCTC 12146 / HTCC2501) TaxID=313596 RepID=A4CPD4_ROBBH|nr:MFS transporter [Robiginitalea biformata]EAR14255.1 Major facilitator superfamily MFS_1 [Robiginitalea biformata HTCC2501]